MSCKTFYLPEVLKRNNNKNRYRKIVKRMEMKIKVSTSNSLSGTEILCSACTYENYVIQRFGQHDI